MNGAALDRRAVLRALGVDSLPDWKIAVPRERIVPARMKAQAQMKLDELRRLEEKRMQAAKDGAATTANAQVSAQA